MAVPVIDLARHEGHVPGDPKGSRSTPTATRIKNRATIRVTITNVDTPGITDNTIADIAIMAIVIMAAMPAEATMAATRNTVATAIMTEVVTVNMVTVNMATVNMATVNMENVNMENVNMATTAATAADMRNTATMAETVTVNMANVANVIEPTMGRMLIAGMVEVPAKDIVAITKAKVTIERTADAPSMLSTVAEVLAATAIVGRAAPVAIPTTIFDK